MYAKWKPLPDVVKDKPFTLGDGVNTGVSSFELKNSELFDASNVDSRLYPALKVRDGRTLYLTVTTPNMLSQRNNANLLALDGGTWKYYNGSAWTNLATGLTSAMAKTEDFVTGTSRYTIFSNGTDRKRWDGVTVTDLGNMPQSNKFTVKDGRVYVLDKDDMVISALNNPNDYSTANDYARITITKAKGDGSAITHFANAVLVWTQYSMHKLYGTYYKNFELIEVSDEIGCVSDRTPLEVGGRLYWLGRNHVYEYTGGTRPKPISFKVDRYIDSINWSYAYKACAGTDGRRYYLSIPTNGATENNLLLVYDTEIGNWYVEDSNFVDFTELSNKFYGVTLDGKIKLMFGSETDDGVNIPWYALTKVFHENTLDEKKALKELNFIVHVRSGATLNISISTEPDGENFTLVKQLNPTNDLINQKIMIPVNVAHNADWMRIKFEGTGKTTIHDIERKLRVIRRG